MTVVIEEMVIQTKIVDNTYDKNLIEQKKCDNIMKELVLLKMELRKKKLLSEW